MASVLHIEDFLLEWLDQVARGVNLVRARRVATRLIALTYGVSSQTIHSQLVRELGYEGTGAVQQLDQALEEWIEGDSTILRCRLALRFEDAALDRLLGLVKCTTPERGFPC